MTAGSGVSEWTRITKLRHVFSDFRVMRGLACSFEFLFVCSCLRICEPKASNLFLVVYNNVDTLLEVIQVERLHGS